MANIARDGAPKAPQPIVAHGGMSHQTKDGLAAGISRTQSAAALDGDKLPTDRPAVGKRLDPVALHPGMTARQHAEFAAQHESGGSAADVFDEAVLSVK